MAGHAEGTRQARSGERNLPGPLRRLVHEYGWVHLSVGIAGNFTFFAGSICFLPTFSDAVKTAGVWLFIVGSFLMLLGALGNLAASLLERR